MSSVGVVTDGDIEDGDVHRGSSIHTVLDS